jgi:ribulose-5-phosphate 4-epimerase/fuculose-1-phosphate aldolase
VGDSIDREDIMKYQSVREQVFETVQEANRVGLIRLSAGNISSRVDPELVAITPTGVKYNHMKPEDISIADLDGNLVDGLPPSSETPMHTAILRSLPEVQAICHTHSTYAICFAMLGQDVPMANLELMVVGAPVPVAPWACLGTPKAGKVTVEIFRNRPALRAILLRKHGLVAIGKSLEYAFEMAYDAEVGFQTYHQALQVGKPDALDATQAAEIKARYFS